MAKSLSSTSKIPYFKRFGILSLTWTSEHYELEYVKSLITSSGFEIINIQHIGSHVYEPLADYYAQNRMRIKDIILKERAPTHLQNILYKVIERVVYNSALKMKEASQIYRLCADKGKHVIDLYAWLLYMYNLIFFVSAATFSPVLPILPVNAYCLLQVFICIQLQPLLPEEFNRAGDTHPICTIRKIKNNLKLSEL